MRKVPRIRSTETSDDFQYLHRRSAVNFLRLVDCSDLVLMRKGQKVEWYEWLVGGILLGIGVAECAWEIYFQKRKAKREQLKDQAQKWFRRIDE
jgi:hypothetical protein